MSEIGKLWVTVGLKDSELKKGIQTVEQDFAALGQKLQKTGAILTAAVTLPIAMMFKGMIDGAMQLEATAAKYNTVFEGMTEEADAFIAKFKELTPATEAEARTMASSIQDLLIPMKFTREEATALTGEFMHVTGALANFNSAQFTTEEISHKVQRAVLGEMEGIKELGVQAGQAEIKAKMLAMGYEGLTGEAEKRAKTEAILALIYEYSTDALTAYTEENLDSKTKMALMRAELGDLAAKFGTHLLPVINAVVAVLRGFVGFLDKIPGPIRILILGFMGLAAVVGPFLVIFGTFLTMLPQMKIGLAMLAKLKMGVLLTAFKTVTIAAWNFTAALLANPITWIIIGIVLLIAAIVLLVKNWDWVVEKFKQGWEFIKNAGIAVWDWFKELPAKFLQWGKDIINNIWEGIKATWEKFKKGISDIGQAIKDFFNPFKKSSPSLIELVQSGTHKIMEAYQGIEVPRMNVQRAAVAGVSAGGGGSVTNTFHIGAMHVRDDSDIEKIASKLYDLQTRRDRGV